MNKRGLIAGVMVMFVMFLGVSLEAQIGASNPYSRFGVGSEFQINNVRSLSMSNISYGLRSNNNINFRNPASYTSFDSSSFLFEAGIAGSSLRLNTFEASEKSSSASVSHLLMGFPVLRWWRTSFGFIPTSSSNYSVEDLVTTVNGKTSYRFSGDGGLNRVYMGHAIRLGKYFSVGVNANYFFGTINHIQRIEFPDSVDMLALEVKNDISVSDYALDYGVQFHKKLTKSMRLGIGATYTGKRLLAGEKEYLVRSYRGVGDIINYKDTVAYEIDDQAFVQMPQGYGLGFTLEQNGKWLVGVDYEWKNWANTLSFDDSSPKANTFAISLGGEYTPNRYYALTYWQKMDYRLGVRYAKTPLVFRNQQIDEFGITFGLGLPIKGLFLQGSKSKVNVGMELGRRGTLENDLLSETYVNFRLSVSIYEWWFMKRKFD